MSPQTLLIQGLVIVTGVFCLFIAAQLGKRVVKGDDKLAWSAFRVWWLGIGLSTALGAVKTLMILSAVDNALAYVWLGYISTAVICVALWGLLFYLLFLYTGNKGLALPLGVFYLLVFAGLVVYSFFVLKPTGVVLDASAVTATIQYEQEANPLYVPILALLVLLPQILGSLAYFSFYFRVRERVQKYRVLLVSVSILVWFGIPLLALPLDLSGLPWWSLATRIIGLAAVLAIYWAYYPPKFIQRRFRVSSI